MADAPHQIVYVSRAVASLSEDEATGLCRAAVERDRGVGITGLLLRDGMRFIKAIEGEEAASRALMARITRDPRHHSSGYVSDGPIAARPFGDGGMDDRRVDDIPAAADFLAAVKPALAGVEDPGLLAHFIGFAEIGRGGTAARLCPALRRWPVPLPDTAPAHSNLA